ncbi:hypothetical protein RIF29_16828 [Crotalaria pallida]|uniref:Uncharacterized protein n=1 Tax=Crotalaria pallida TaxID=3830 RepID=A0AAN9FI35_CROPI
MMITVNVSIRIKQTTHVFTLVIRTKQLFLPFFFQSFVYPSLTYSLTHFRYPFFKTANFSLTSLLTEQFHQKTKIIILRKKTDLRKTQKKKKNQTLTPTTYPSGFSFT